MKTTIRLRRFTAVTLALFLLFEGFAFAQMEESEQAASPTEQVTEQPAEPTSQCTSEGEQTATPTPPTEPTAQPVADTATADDAVQKATIALAEYETLLERYLTALDAAQTALKALAASPEDTTLAQTADTATAAYNAAYEAIASGSEVLLQAYEYAGLTLPADLPLPDGKDEHALPVLTTAPPQQSSDMQQLRQPTAEPQEQETDTALQLAAQQAPSEPSHEAVKQVQAQIDSLPSASDITVSAFLETQVQQVASARAAFDTLSAQEAALVANLGVLERAEEAVQRASIELEKLKECCRITDSNIEHISANLSPGETLQLMPLWVWVGDSEPVDTSDYAIKLTLEAGSESVLTLSGTTLTAKSDLTAPTMGYVVASCDDVPGISLRYSFLVKPPISETAKKYIFPMENAYVAFNLNDLRSAVGDYVEADSSLFEPITIACVADGIDYEITDTLASTAWVQEQDNLIPSWIEVLPADAAGTVSVRINIQNKGVLEVGQYSAKLTVTTQSSNTKLAAFTTQDPLTVVIYDDMGFDFENATVNLNLLGDLSQPIDIGEVPSSITSFVITRENDVVKQLHEQTYALTVQNNSDGDPHAYLSVRSGMTPKAGKTTLKVQTNWANGGFSVTNITVSTFKPAPRLRLSTAAPSMQNVQGDAVQGLLVYIPNGEYVYKLNKQAVLTLRSEDITDVSVAPSGLTNYAYQDHFKATHSTAGAFSLEMLTPIPANSRGKVPSSVRVRLNVTLTGLSEPLPIDITVKLPTASVRLSKSSVTLYSVLGVGGHEQSVTVVPTPSTASYTLNRVEYQTPEDEGAFSIVQTGAALTIATTAGATVKTYRLKLWFDGIPKPVSLSVRVDKRANAARLQRSTLTLTATAPNEKATAKLTLSALHKDGTYDLAIYEYIDKTTISTQPFTALDIAWDGELLSVTPNAQTEAGKTYVLDIGFDEVQQVAKHVKLTVKVLSPSRIKLTGSVSGRLDVTNPGSMVSMRVRLSGAANTKWYSGLTRDDFTLTDSDGLLELTGFDASTATLLIGFNHEMWNSAKMRANAMKAIPFTITLKHGGTDVATLSQRVSLMQSAVRTAIAWTQLNPDKPRQGTYGMLLLLNAAQTPIAIQSITQQNKQSLYTVSDLGDGYYRIQYTKNAVSTVDDSLTLRVTPKGGAKPVTVKLSITNGEAQ